MFALNGTYVIFIFLFLVFIYLLNEILLKPLGRVVEKRALNSATDLEAAKTCSAEMEKMLKDYQAALHSSRLEAQSLIKNALGEVQQLRDGKVKEIQTEGHAKLDKLKNELAANRHKLLQSLISPELDLVKEIIVKLLGEAPALVTNEQRVLQVLEETR